MVCVCVRVGLCVAMRVCVCVCVCEGRLVCVCGGGVWMHLCVDSQPLLSAVVPSMRSHRRSTTRDRWG